MKTCHQNWPVGKEVSSLVSASITMPVYSKTILFSNKTHCTESLNLDKRIQHFGDFEPKDFSV